MTPSLDTPSGAGSGASQLFTFNIRHYAEVENKVANALCNKALSLKNMSTTTIGFEELKNCYVNGIDLEIFIPLFQTTQEKRLLISKF